MRTVIFSFLALSLSITACKSKKNSTKTPKAPIKEVVAESGFEEPKDNAPFTVKSAKISGDILTLEVEYSGGCEKHEFDMYFNGMYMKSMPPKAGLILVHKNNADACRELITQKLQFDLTTTRYGDTKDYTIIFSINNYEGTVDYVY